MMVGFFMILVDATIVAVANPSIMEKLGAGYDAVIWVTSAYLLAYAVPLLLAGRLGDRYGPKNLYLLGLAVFTAASLWCGLAGSIEMLIAARVRAGRRRGAAHPADAVHDHPHLPAERRGVAMSVWGATAGVATLVGPLAGGVLVDGLGWQWIFFVNVPIGIIGLGLAFWLVPVLPTQKHRLDLLGVLLSGVGMFLIVFALQEGQSHNWAPWIWGTIAGGVGFMAAFVYWQSVNRNEPLIPLRHLPRPRLQPVQPWSRDHRFRRDGDDAAGDVLCAGGVWAVADTVRAADGADGDRDRGAGARRRQDRRPIPSAPGGRLRLLDAGDRVDLAVDRDDADHADLASGVTDDGDGCRDGVHLVAAGGHRHPQPATAAGRCGFRASTTPPGRWGRCWAAPAWRRS